MDGTKWEREVGGRGRKERRNSVSSAALTSGARGFIQSLESKEALWKPPHDRFQALSRPSLHWFLPLPPPPQEVTGASAGLSRGTSASSDPVHWPRAPCLTP